MPYKNKVTRYTDTRIQNFGKVICCSTKALLCIWEEQTPSRSFKTWQRLHKPSHRRKSMHLTDTLWYLRGRYQLLSSAHSNPTKQVKVSQIHKPLELVPHSTCTRGARTRFPYTTDAVWNLDYHIPLETDAVDKEKQPLLIQFHSLSLDLEITWV